MIGRAIFILSAAATLGAGVAVARGSRSAVPYFRSATMTPEWLTDREASSPSMHHVAPFQFSNQLGDRVTERALDGRVTIVSFFFTRCGDVCPTTTSNLARLVGSMPNESRLQVISYSVAPDADSIPALRAFAVERHITDPRWHLLTGARTEIERVAGESYFVSLGDGSTYGVASIAHTESVLLVDGCGRIRGVYAGTLGLEMQRLHEDAVALLRERCARQHAAAAALTPLTTQSSLPR